MTRDRRARSLSLAGEDGELWLAPLALFFGISA